MFSDICPERSGYVVLHFLLTTIAAFRWGAIVSYHRSGASLICLASSAPPCMWSASAPCNVSQMSLTSVEQQNHRSCRRHPSSLPIDVCCRWESGSPLLSSLDKPLAKTTNGLFWRAYPLRESPQTRRPPRVVSRASSRAPAVARRSWSRSRRPSSCRCFLLLNRTLC